jgi:grdX protein
MFELRKAILVTNNDRVYDKYKDKLSCVYTESYEDTLIKVRDYVYNRHKLLTHPQASSLKPNQTPYRSVVVYPAYEDNTQDILLIEKCIEVFNSWQSIAKTPSDYKENVREDFKTIDLSVIDNIMDRII